MSIVRENSAVRRHSLVVHCEEEEEEEDPEEAYPWAVMVLTAGLQSRCHARKSKELRPGALRLR